MRLSRFLAIAIAFASLASAAPVHAESLVRGQSLYETKCYECHTRSVHSRASRKAKSFMGIRREVARWEGTLGASWSKEEIDDVTLYLNETYYKYRCPQTICKNRRASYASAL